MSPNASVVATQNVTVKITPNDKGNPPGQVADAEIQVNGERRSFALLRPVADTNAQDRVRDLILAAYTEYEQAA